jgi:hypothetical protein
MGRGNLAFLSGAIRGHYHISAASGLTTGIAAAGTLFSARMAGTGAAQYVRALIQRLHIQIALVTPFTAAQEVQAAAYIAYNWSAADSGGTALTLTAPEAMLNDIADVPPTMAINMATTAALTAGTRTLRANPFLVCAGAQDFAASAETGQEGPFSAEYSVTSNQEFPINLQGAALWQGLGNAYGPEGIVITNGILQGAVGTARILVNMDWVEYDAATNIGGQR